MHTHRQTEIKTIQFTLCRRIKQEVERGREREREAEQTQLHTRTRLLKEGKEKQQLPRSLLFGKHTVTGVLRHRRVKRLLLRFPLVAGEYL